MRFLETNNDDYTYEDEESVTNPSKNDLAYRRGLGKCEFLHKIDDSDEYYDDTDDYRFLELGIELDRNNNNHKITT